MFRKFIALICALFLLASCAPASDPSTAPSVPASTAPSAEPSFEPTVAPSPEPILVTPHYTTGRGDEVDGLFTVTLPESWRDICAVEYDETDTTYGLSFYQKAAKDAGFGGWLFTLTSFPEGLDYSHYPQYELLGAIRSGGFDEHIVAIYPFDVQFDEEQREGYERMTADIPSILDSLTVADGCEFIPADELNLRTIDKQTGSPNLAFDEPFYQSFASYQVLPHAASAMSGTFSGMTDCISSQSRRLTSSARASGVSTISSSCT